MTAELRDQLLEYVAARRPDLPGLSISDWARMPEGWSRECYRLTLTWEGDEPGSRELILRRDPAGSIVYTDRIIEDGVIKALEDSRIPVPVTWFLETDSGRLGAPFMLMERLTGSSSPTQLYAPENAENRAAIGHEFVRLLAHLHSLDWTKLELPFTEEPPTVGTAAERTLDKWLTTLHEQQYEPLPFMEQAAAWLRENKPVAPRISLLHGDYRTGNFLFEGDRLTGVVDWELASLGDPLEDLGWVFKQLWRLEDKVCGFFAEEEFLRLYEEHSGIAVDREALRWWIAMSEFKHSVYGVTGTRTSTERLTDELNFSIAHLYLPPLMNEQAKIIGI